MANFPTRHEEREYAAGVVRGDAARSRDVAQIDAADDLAASTRRRTKRAFLGRWWRKRIRSAFGRGYKDGVNGRVPW